MERIGTLVVAPSTDRKAEPSRFGAALRAAATQLASGIATSAALAAPYAPGGPVLAGALRAAARPASPLPSASGLGAGESRSSGDMMEATRTLQQQAQSFNLEYLQLQEAMQRESREFTAVSNVMKVKHDSAKAAINNIH
jgi:signal transduction protein with GAF and PtsI domain